MCRVTIVWFSDEDRQRMRRETRESLERDRLFWEFIDERQRTHGGGADRSAGLSSDRILRLRIRPWPDDR
jgi:hypothetical protein